MDWGALQDACVAAVQGATGLTSVRFGGESSAWRNDVYVDLSLRSPVALGIDEYRTDYAATDPDDVAAVCGIRTFVLSVRIEAVDHIDGADSPGHYAGLLRTRLRRPTILAALAAAGIALARIEKTVEQSFVAEDRAYSLSVTDVLVSVAETDPDTTADPSDYIESVTVDSDTLDDPDGEPHDPQVDLEIPET